MWVHGRIFEAEMKSGLNVVHCDNLGDVFAYTNCKCGCPMTHVITAEIQKERRETGVTEHVTFVKSQRNPSDPASRGNVAKMLELYPRAEEVAAQVMEKIIDSTPWEEWLENHRQLIELDMPAHQKRKRVRKS